MSEDDEYSGFFDAPEGEGQQVLSFDDYCNLLLPFGALNSPSELHGLLCGKLCGGARLSIDEWLQSAWELLDVTDTPDGQANDEVSNLMTVTLAQLNSGDYDFQLMLPDDDADLGQRTLALSQWCHGFLSGFGSAGIDPESTFSSDNADALRDMAAIVQVAVADDQEEDDQEADYYELVEYVRVVAMNFYAEHYHDDESTTVH